MLSLNINPEETLSQARLSIPNVDVLIDQLVDHIVSFGFKLIIAVIAFIIGRWIIQWLRKLINRFFERKKVESTVKSFLNSAINIFLQITLFFIIVNIVKIPIISFTAVLAAAGLAIGMAMKDNLGNFAGGVMLLINKPFRVGNRILVQGMDGTVQSIGILYTVLLTSDNRTIYIPNGPLSTGTITNFSNQKERRIDITLNIGFGSDICKLKSLLQDIIDEDPLINKNPAPFIGLTTLNNGTIDLTIKVWVKNPDYGNVNISLNEKIYTILRDNNVYAPSMLSVKMIKD